MRVLVCGSRKFSDRGAVYSALDAVHARRGISCLIHGAASGADTLADQWAKEHGVARLPFPADWDNLGKAAGPIRNQRMIDEGKPDGVVAFPGQNGTADMVRRAEAAGLKVWKPKPRGG